jgi:DNA polymerase-3 subunit alpha
MFDKEYVEFSKYFITGYYLLIKGKVQKRKFREEEIEFRIKTINLLSSVKDELIKSVTIKIDVADLNRELINTLTEFFRRNKGETELKFMFTDHEDKIALPMFSRKIRIRLNNELINFLEDQPGIEYKVN